MNSSSSQGKTLSVISYYKTLALTQMILPEKLLWVSDQIRLFQSKRSHSSIASLRISALNERRVCNKLPKSTKDSRRPCSSKTQNKKNLQLNYKSQINHLTISLWNWQHSSPLRSHRLLMCKTARAHRSTYQQKIIALPEIRPLRTNWNKYYRVCLFSKKSNKISQVPIRNKKCNRSTLQIQLHQLLSKWITLNLINRAYLAAQWLDQVL